MGQILHGGATTTEVGQEERFRHVRGKIAIEID